MRFGRVIFPNETTQKEKNDDVLLPKEQILQKGARKIDFKGFTKWAERLVVIAAQELACKFVEDSFSSFLTEDSFSSFLTVIKSENFISRHKLAVSSLRS